MFDSCKVSINPWMFSSSPGGQGAVGLLSPVVPTPHSALLAPPTGSMEAPGLGLLIPGDGAGQSGRGLDLHLSWKAEGLWSLLLRHLIVTHATGPS